MTEFLEIDGVAEKDLPAHTRDGRTGDRVSFMEGGLLHVRYGLATFVRWADVLGAFEHHGRAYVLVPRRPPAAPWIEVTRAELGGAQDGVAGFLRRIEAQGSGGGGYREAVRTRRQNLSMKELRDRIAKRAPVPGALEVPSTIMLGVSYPGLGLVQALVFFGIGGLGYVAMVAAPIVSGALQERAPFLNLVGYALFLACTVLASVAAVYVGKRWKAAKNRTLPRQRVLVLAPDGCIVGFTSGVRTFSWIDVGRFAIGPATDGDGLVVYDANGRCVGAVDAAWIDAPLPLVVRVAEVYRMAALDD